MATSGGFGYLYWSGIVDQKIMKILTVLSVLLLTVLCGCKSPESTRIVSRTIAMNGTYFGLREYPEARPYVMAATAVICNAASSANTNQQSVVAQLESIPKDEAGILLINSVLSIWFAYPPETPNGKAALQGVCEGANAALLMRTSLQSGMNAAPRLPHIRSRKEP